MEFLAFLQLGNKVHKRLKKEKEEDGQKVEVKKDPNREESKELRFTRLKHHIGLRIIINSLMHQEEEEERNNMEKAEKYYKRNHCKIEVIRIYSAG